MKTDFIVFRRGPGMRRLGATLAIALPMASGAAGAGATPAPAPDCSAPVTTAAMTQCAYDDFLAASADEAAKLKALRSSLPVERRRLFDRSQKAWLAWRTQACSYEASAASGGSLAPVLQWQCTARMTRERTQALSQMSACPAPAGACTGMAPAASTLPAASSAPAPAKAAASAPLQAASR